MARKDSRLLLLLSSAGGAVSYTVNAVAGSYSISGAAATFSIVAPDRGGGADPRLWDGRRRHRCILPDGSVCYATKSEMRAILAKVAFEIGDTERVIVPTIKRERKRVSKTYSLPEEAQFPIRAEIVMPREVEPVQFNVDTEAMVRAYVQGERDRRRRKDEEEWLLMLVH